VSYQLNGGPAVTSGCNTFTFGPTQTINPSGTENTLLVSFNGDGVTDGLLVDVTAVTSTPGRFVWRDGRDGWVRWTRAGG
jgi:hypothetical protein